MAWAIAAFLAAVAGLFYSVSLAGPPGSTRQRPSSPFALPGGDHRRTRLDTRSGGGWFRCGHRRVGGEYLLGPTSWATASGIVGYLLMMVVLLMRPYGLFKDTGDQKGRRGRPLLYTSYEADQGLLNTTTKKVILALFFSS